MGKKLKFNIPPPCLALAGPQSGEYVKTGSSN
jgi:hypothetical protein